MSGPALGAAGFVAVLLLIALRVPVGVAMAAVGALGYGLAAGWSTLPFVLGRAPFDAVFAPSLAVLPLFIVMGVYAAHGGLARALYEAVAAFLGHLRGGLAMATVGACAVFGAICGSAIATAATMGRVALPEMRRLGYDERLAAASVAAGGTLGVMIPPSILFVLYGLMTEQSIGKLLAAGVLPGLLGSLLYMLAVRVAIARDPRLGPAATRQPWAVRATALRAVWPVAVLFATVLGGLYSGWFSPTEAAAVGAFGAIALALLRGRLPVSGFLAAARESAATIGMVVMILIGAGVFNFFLDTTGFADALVRTVRDLGWDRWTVLLLLVLFYLALGALMDELAMLFLTIGPVFKLVTALGFDPIWFGVLFVTLCEIGMILPPVGINLFVIQGVSGLPFGTVVRGIAPFVAADLVRLALLVLAPGLALWLPAALDR